MRKIIVALLLAIIVGGSTATTMASPWKFAVLADIRAKDADNSNGALEFLATDIKNQGVDLVIFPGDMIGRSDNIIGYEKHLDSWKSMMKPLYDAGIPVYVVRGNHEADSTMGNNSNLWLNEFPILKYLASPDGGFTYSFTHKNAKFVGFDQYIDPEGRMMDSWVTNQIDDSTSPLNFAFGHEPLFSVTGQDDMSKDPDSLEALVSALGTHNGSYLCGHDHLYLRANVYDGQGHTVPELIVGTAGKDNYDYAPTISNHIGSDDYTVEKIYSNSDNPYFGYLLVTVYDNNTWTGEFKGFEYTHGLRKSQFPAIQTLDRFNI